MELTKIFIIMFIVVFILILGLLGGLAFVGINATKALNSVCCADLKDDYEQFKKTTNENNEKLIKFIGS
jgi:hypothetical protein